MTDSECVAFLQWALPRLRMRWSGFRRVRRQLCKRISRRMRELGLPDASAYREHLATHPAEWTHLDGLCRIPISRFYRDRAVFDALGDVLLPELAERARARPGRTLCGWSIGCAAGEEPYTLQMIWQARLRARFPDVRLRLVATEVDENLLQRARSGCFGRSSLKELPEEWVSTAFERANEHYCLLPKFREGIEFQRHDVRSTPPEGPFLLVLCRNLVFTYFDVSLQQEILRRIVVPLLPGGILVVGAHELLPEGSSGFSRWALRPGIYRRCETRGLGSASAE